MNDTQAQQICAIDQIRTDRFVVRTRQNLFTPLKFEVQDELIGNCFLKKNVVRTTLNKLRL